MTVALAAVLARALPEASPVELAEALWLAQYSRGAAPPLRATPASAPTGESDEQPAASTRTSESTAGEPSRTADPNAELYPDTPGIDGAGDIADELRVGGPRVPALPDPLRVTRAMRPLRRRVPSRHAQIIDEAATADRIAVEGLWLPVQRAQFEPPFNLALIADTSPSMLVWRRTLQEFHTLLRQLGAFRMISTYSVDTEPVRHGPLQLTPLGAAVDTPIAPATILDPTQRLLIFVVTDGIGAAWHDGRMDQLVQRWAAVNPVQVVNVLPRRLWRGTGLRTTFGSTRRGHHGDRVPVTVVELSTDGMRRCAVALTANAVGASTGGTGTVRGEILMHPVGARTTVPVDPAELVRRFFQLASPPAQRLAGWFAAAPLTLPIMRLIQQVMLPGSAHAHLAEVFVSGLLVQRFAHPLNPELTEFDFQAGVRDLLLDHADRYETLQVLVEVSRYVTDRLGQPLDFPALLVDPASSRVPELSAGTLPVARIAATVLRRLGARYAGLADRLDQAANTAAERQAALIHGQSSSPDQPELQPGRPARIDSPGAQAVLIGMDGSQNPQLSAIPQIFRNLYEFAFTLPLPNEPDVLINRSLPAVREAVARAAASAQDLLLVCWSGHSTRDDQGELALWTTTSDPDQISALLPASALIEDIERNIGSAAVLLLLDCSYASAVRLPSRGRWYVIAAAGATEEAHSGSRRTLFLDLFIEVLTNGDPTLPPELTVDDVYESMALRAGEQGVLLPSPMIVNDPKITLGPNHAISDVATSRHVFIEYANQDRAYVERLAAYLRRVGIPVWSSLDLRIGDSLTGTIRRLETSVALIAVTSPSPTPSDVVSTEAAVGSALARGIPVLPLSLGGPVPPSLNGLQPETVSSGELPSAEFVERLQRLTEEPTSPQPSVTDQSDAEYDPEDTEQINEEAFARRQSALGPDHPETLAFARSLALRQSAMGNHERARQLYEDVLDHQRRVLGDDHPDTLTSAADLSFDLRVAGHFTAARELDEDILDRRRRVLGNDHPDTLNSASNLAMDLRAVGDDAAARALEEDTFDRRRRVLGDDHPDTFNSATALAADLRSLAEFGEARALDEGTLTRRRRVLGDDHPDTLTSASNLADDLRSLAEFEEARTLDEDTLTRRRRVLGDDHPDTLTSASNLAADLWFMGEYAAARTLDEDTLTRRRRVLGDDHPTTLNSAADLAYDLRSLGEYAAARTLDGDTLTRRRRVLGDEHPDTLNTADNLAADLRALGEYAAARALDGDTLTRRRRVLGDDHPDTLTSASNLADDLRALGEDAAARGLDEDTLTRRRRVLGDDHPDTLNTASNLVTDLRALGEHEAANTLDEDTLTRRRRVLGDDHPDAR